MANLRDIRRRIKSVKNTAQITRAMQLVAASKMKKAQDQALSGRAYADLMNKLLVNLRENTDEEEHPLLQERKGGKELVILITTDKGLCGPLNTNLLRMVAESTGEDTQFVSVGNKGKQYLGRQKKNLLADFHIKDPVSFSETKQVSRYLTEQFLEGNCDRVRVGFTNFINTVKQEPLIETLLPIRPIDLGRDKQYVGVGKKSEEAVHVPLGSAAGTGGYIFEPNARSVLDTIVPQYVDYELYQMILM